MATPERSEPIEAGHDQYLRGVECLIDAVQRLSLARELPAVQRIVRTAARELTGADGATFVLRDGDKCYYADEDAIAPLWKGNRFPMDICISGWVMLNRQSTVIPDIYKDARIPIAAYRPTFVKSLAMVPIRTLAPIGAIGNYWARPYRPSDRELSLLQALADSTAVAMENVSVYSELEQRVKDRTAELERANEEIRRISLTDELTGLHNRRGFYLLAQQALKQARRNSAPLTVLLIDVDGLKRVNDQHGHETGDELIGSIARALRASFRESDVIGRLGGDEFGVIAFEPPAAIEVIRARLEQQLAGHSRSDRPYRLKASVGGVSLTDPDEPLDALLARADQAMYQEKRARKAARVD